MMFCWYLITGFLAVMIPLLSAALWFFILDPVLPSLKGHVAILMGLRKGDKWRRDISISVVQILFFLSCIISVSLSLIMEIGLGLPLILLFGIDNPYVMTVMVVSAGPVEEIMKFFASILIFIIVIRSVQGMNDRIDRVKLGIISGLFTGACFGIVESIGYLSPLLWEIGSNGMDARAIDALAWRIVLGVSIHALYTGLACGGMGRPKSSRIRVTLILLGIAIILHGLNNATEGIVILILEMDGMTGYIITDSLQFVLFMILVFLIAMVWRGKIFPHTDTGYEYPPMKRGSKMIYPSRRDRFRVKGRNSHDRTKDDIEILRSNRSLIGKYGGHDHRKWRNR